MAEIEVMSSCLVGTRCDIASSISRMELTTWDLRFLPRNYIKRGLIFQKPQEMKENWIHGLKASLSHTLEFFPPLAGRLGSTAHDGNMLHFFVDCNNAGAEFLHAVAAHVSVSDILEAKYTPQIVYFFFPRDGVYNFQGVSTPLLAVQVTELADGIFIACSANHSVVDGSSFWHFINSWSQLSRGFDTISNPPVFDRSWFPIDMATDDDRLLVHYPTVERNLPAPPSPTARQKLIHFSKESVANLKAKANSEATTHKISSLQAVLALLWRSIIRGQLQSTPTSRGQEEVVHLSMLVGARARLASTLPESYFGNAAYVAVTATGEGDLLHEKGFGYAALKISDLVSQQTSETAIRDAQKKEFPPIPRRLLCIGSSPRFDVYGNDFGWGKPVGVRSGETHKRDGFVVLFPAPEAGGIDVELCLAQETFEAMESDADFVGALTT